MKKFLKIIGIIVAVIALGIGAVFYMTSGMVDVADGFLAAVAADDMDAAQGYLSEAFLESTPLAEVAVFARQFGLDAYTASSWSSRSFSGGTGKIEGSITTDDGGTIPLSIDFVKENGSWKIYYIRRPASGMSDEEVELVVPSEAEMVGMVTDTMALFAQAINEKDMQAFYDSCSGLWKRQTTPEELEQAFAVFIEREINMSVLTNFPPRFKAPPELDANNILRVAGHFPTRPNIHFEQSYVYEGLGWKLFGINVNLE